jgi:hypothetical protein
MASKTIDRFRGIDQQLREDQQSARIRRSREAHFAAVDWARSVGFSRRQAPFAASVASMMKVQKKRPVTAAEVRARMLDQWPDLEKV